MMVYLFVCLFVCVYVLAWPLQNTGVEGGETAIKLARRWGYEVKGVEQVGNLPQLFVMVYHPCCFVSVLTVCCAWCWHFTRVFIRCWYDYILILVQQGGTKCAKISKFEDIECRLEYNSCLSRLGTTQTLVFTLLKKENINKRYMYIYPFVSLKSRSLGFTIWGGSCWLYRR